MPTDIHSEDFKDFGQFRKPTGTVGHDVVEGMNRSHYELTTWGLQQVQIHPQGTILDIGCGGGITVERLTALAPESTVYGVDHSLDCVHWASERNRAQVESGRVHILQASVEKLPFDDASFDKILAVETVYFWPDLAQNITEVARVTKPGGQFVIINECYASEQFRERNQRWADTCGMRILSPEETETLLKQSGFARVETFLQEEQNWICSVATK